MRADRRHRQLHLEFVRRQKGLTQRQLAHEVRLDQMFISMIERGEALPVPDQANRIAAFLGIPVELLTQPVEIAIEPESADATA